MSPLDNDIERLENAVRLFAQAMKRPQRWAVVTALAKADIDRPSAVILQTLALERPRPCHVQELAQRLGIEPPSVTRKTQELEQAGHLRRVPDPSDRRAVTLHITPKGRKMAERLWQAQRSIIADALRDWDITERREFVRLFERFSTDLARTSTGPVHATGVLKATGNGRAEGADV